MRNPDAPDSTSVSFSCSFVVLCPLMSLRPGPASVAVRYLFASGPLRLGELRLLRFEGVAGVIVDDVSQVSCAPRAQDDPQTAIHGMASTSLSACSALRRAAGLASHRAAAAYGSTARITRLSAAFAAPLTSGALRPTRTARRRFSAAAAAAAGKDAPPDSAAASSKDTTGSSSASAEAGPEAGGEQKNDAAEASQESGEEQPHIPDLEDRIAGLIHDNRVVLFMKGSPDEPQCGFSAQCVQILGREGFEDYTFVNVLSNEQVFEAMKNNRHPRINSDWPTVPQLFVGGEFVGGSDIVLQMHAEGELTGVLWPEGKPEPAPSSEKKSDSDTKNDTKRDE